jgi:hypothetical protein
MMDKETRLQELRSRSELSDAEMRELIDLSKPGELLSLPTFDSLGVINVERAFANLGELIPRADSAFQAGYYLETISLRLQHIELWLRMFWVAKNRGGMLFDQNDRRTFGQIVEDCARLAFDPALVHDLRSFNQHRINAIHKFLLGGTDYQELRQACEAFATLPKSIGEYTRSVVGIPLKS